MTGPGANGSTPAQAVGGRMAELRDEFVDFIAQLVLEESPSTDPKAQRGIRAILTEALHDVGLEVEHVAGTWSRAARERRRTGRQPVGRNSSWDTWTRCGPSARCGRCRSRCPTADCPAPAPST